MFDITSINIKDHELLARAVCGSRLYGTNNANSDTDYVNIYRCKTSRFITHRYEKAYETQTSPDAKNTSADRDEKFYELQTFIRDCLGGQTYALDLLYTPDGLFEYKHPVFEQILTLKKYLVTNKLDSFVHYCRSQAAKYSNKGTKYNELTLAIANCDGFMKVCDHNPTTLEAYEHGCFRDLSQFKLRRRTETDVYVDGPDCKFPVTRMLHEVVPVLHTKLHSFGSRTMQAAANGNMDLKAYYHALRVIWQLEEYLANGCLVFPGPRVQDLIDVRNHKYEHEYIEKWIDAELERVLAIPNTLPAPNKAFWESWIHDHYMLWAYKDFQELPEGLFANLPSTVVSAVKTLE